MSVGYALASVDLTSSLMPRERLDNRGRHVAMDVWARPGVGERPLETAGITVCLSRGRYLLGSGCCGHQDAP